MKERRCCCYWIVFFFFFFFEREKQTSWVVVDEVCANSNKCKARSQGQHVCRFRLCTTATALVVAAAALAAAQLPWCALRPRHPSLSLFLLGVVGRVGCVVVS